MTDEQIKHMVNRFLSWKLPSNFNPDAGVSYARPNYAREIDATPSGTNLFDATQANAMVRHMIEGLPAPADAKPVAYQIDCDGEPFNRMVGLVANRYCKPTDFTLYGKAAFNVSDWAECASLVESILYHAQLGARPQPAPTYADGVEAWQPIDTAPADIELLLGYWSEWPHQKWEVKADLYSSTRGGWRDSWATHWQPLPAPPAVSRPNRCAPGAALSGSREVLSTDRKELSQNGGGE